MNVHTDLTNLIEVELLECDEDGKLSAPYDEIFIPAGVRDTA